MRWRQAQRRLLTVNAHVEVGTTSNPGHYAPPKTRREVRIKFKECRRKESPSEDPWGLRLDRLAKLDNLPHKRGGWLLRNKAPN